MGVGWGWEWEECEWGECEWGGGGGSEEGELIASFLAPPNIKLGSGLETSLRR